MEWSRSNPVNLLTPILMATIFKIDAKQPVQRLAMRPPQTFSKSRKSDQPHCIDDPRSKSKILSNRNDRDVCPVP